MGLKPQKTLKLKTYRVEFREGVPVRFRTRGHAWKPMDQAPKPLLDRLGGMLVHVPDVYVMQVQVVSRYTRQALYYQRLREMEKKTKERRKKAA
jgi:hypothetical protein